MKTNFTRGDGILDQFLAQMRAKQAKIHIRNLGSHDKILDVGCGSYPYFLSVVEFKEKYGIDSLIKTGIVEGIILKKLNVESEKLPFKDNFFDCVTMLAVFEHINEVKLNFVLKEVRRVLKTGGTFVIATPSPWSDGLLHLLARLSVISPEEIHEHKHNQTRKIIESLLRQAGFQEENLRSGYFESGLNMWFVAKK